MPTSSSGRPLRRSALAPFQSDWILVGLVGEFRSVGDLRTREIGTESVLVIRSNDGFHVSRNLCPHEDRPMMRRHESGNVARLECPFHSWTFDRTGRYLPGLAAGRNGLASTMFGTRDLERFPVVVAGGAIWSRLAGGRGDPPMFHDRPFGTPSTPTRQVVEGPWQTVVERMRLLPHLAPVPPNSGLVRAPIGSARMLVTVAPIDAGTSEVTAWSEVGDDGDEQGIAGVLRRRSLLARLAGGFGGE